MFSGLIGGAKRGRNDEDVPIIMMRPSTVPMDIMQVSKALSVDSISAQDFVKDIKVDDLEDFYLI